MTKDAKDAVAPCGVFCAACPARVKKNPSCLGCRSEDRSQKRISKWSCKIRSCCTETKGLAFCFECDDLPCSRLLKLQRTHPEDARYAYRHEILDNLEGIRAMGTQTWVQSEIEVRSCPRCGEAVMWYVYECVNCGWRSTSGRHR